MATCRLHPICGIIRSFWVHILFFLYFPALTLFPAFFDLDVGFVLLAAVVPRPFWFSCFRCCAIPVIVIAAVAWEAVDGVAVHDGLRNAPAPRRATRFPVMHAPRCSL